MQRAQRLLTLASLIGLLASGLVGCKKKSEKYSEKRLEMLWKDAVRIDEMTRKSNLRRKKFDLRFDFCRKFSQHFTDKFRKRCTQLLQQRWDDVVKWQVSRWEGGGGGPGPNYAKQAAAAAGKKDVVKMWKADEKNAIIWGLAWREVRTFMGWKKAKRKLPGFCGKKYIDLPKPQTPQLRTMHEQLRTWCLKTIPAMIKKQQAANP